MRTALVSCLVAAMVAVASPALAYGLKDRRPYAPPSALWAGWYLGGHGGFAWGEADGRVTGVDGSASLDLDGGLGGVQVGYNWQSGAFVFGAELDATWGNINGGQTFDLSNVLGFNPAVGTLDNELDHLVSLRARFGYVFDRFLVFGTVGVAFTEYNISGTLDDGVDRFSGSLSKDTTGWVVGGGVDWKVWDRTSLRAEVLHYMFDDIKFTDPALGTLKVDADTTVVRGAINFHFN